MADELIFKNQVLQVDEWPTFAEVAAETHRLNGAAFHAHGGYEKEIYADYVPGATDGVELLQFAVYRGIGLEGWYHILNAGFRFPSVGASDFPYCRALGDCRTYARIDGDATMRAWTDAAVAGRSFITTGPMVEFHRERRGAGGRRWHWPKMPPRWTSALFVRSEVAPITDIECIVKRKSRAAFPARRAIAGLRVAAAVTLPLQRAHKRLLMDCRPGSTASR